ncbi:hypothetical protein DY000_02055986 [Brassica cretica]|uniref:Uncharacterized protein n=1 Tax=Brassica cretica TaxID=69181 RepID=A0ABQ7A526_BRACR|nr:hypothetical protein DY000_02055986 [Brassica cretica]
MLKPENPSHIKWNETRSEASIDQLIGLEIMSIKLEQSVLTCIIVTCNSHKQAKSFNSHVIYVCPLESTDIAMIDPRRIYLASRGLGSTGRVEVAADAGVASSSFSSLRLAFCQHAASREAN